MCLPDKDLPKIGYILKLVKVSNLWFFDFCFKSVTKFLGNFVLSLFWSILHRRLTLLFSSSHHLRCFSTIILGILTILIWLLLTTTCNSNLLANELLRGKLNSILTELNTKLVWHLDERKVIRVLKVLFWNIIWIPIWYSNGL